MTEPPAQPEPTDEPAPDSRAEQAAPPHDERSRSILQFTPDRFMREIRLDLAIRRGLGVLVLIAVLALMLFEQVNSTVGLIVVVALVFAWFGVNSISANIWRALPSVTAMIAHDPALAEVHLADLVKHKPLMRWLRLMLYHRLAAIRHRQHRFAESAAICRTILSQPLGPARKQRGALLLMLAEASLQSRDMYGAYAALSALAAEPLNLAERLQRLAIQTRYEVLAGHDRAALTGVKQKLLLAELMPAPQCGAMHAMLTASAQRAGHNELADWLYRRSELLCGREQLDQLLQGAFAVGVVGPPE